MRHLSNITADADNAAIRDRMPCPGAGETVTPRRVSVGLGFARVRRGSIIQLAAIGAGRRCDLRPRSRWRSRGCPSPAARRRRGSTSSTGSRRSSASCVFSVVAAVLIYSVWKFRVEPGRRLGRAADARPHEARDRLDGDPGGARHRDLDRQRDRARPERHARARTRSIVKVTGAAVRLDVHVPERQDATAP